MTRAGHWLIGTGAVGLLALFSLVLPGAPSALSPPGVVVAITPAGGASSTVAAPALHLVGLGDSVMSGTNCGCDGIIAEYARLMERGTGRRVEGDNLGVPGATTGDLLDDLRHDPETRQAVSAADVIVVIIGANDLSDSLDTWKGGDCDSSCYGPDVAAMRRRLGTILASIRQLAGDRSPEVLVTDYWNIYADGDTVREEGGPAQLDWSAEVTAAANAAIAQAVAAQRDTLVDLSEPFKGRSGLGDPTDLLADDGDHPNAAGVTVIATALGLAFPG